jgi:hypothetical protein
MTLDAELPCRRDARQARDTVVDRDDERGILLGRERHDLGREAVTEFETIRHQKIDVGKTPGPQTAHDERRTRRTVCIEITDDPYSSTAATMRQQQLHGGIDPVERTDGQQTIESGPQPRGVIDTARRIGAGQHGIERTQTPSDALIDGTARDLERHDPPSATAAKTVRWGRHTR